MEDKKIDFLTSASIMLFAMSIDGSEALFDLVSAIPIVGWVLGPPMGEYISIFGGVILASWFFYLGVPFVGKIGTAAVVELIPVVNAVPAYSAAAMLTILSANNETLGGLLGFLTAGGAATKAASAVGAAEKTAEGAAQKALPTRNTRADAKVVGQNEKESRTNPNFKEPAQTNAAAPQQFSDITPKSKVGVSEQSPAQAAQTPATNAPPSNTRQTSVLTQSSLKSDELISRQSAVQNFSDTSIAQTNPREEGVGLDDIAHPPAQPDPALGTSLESGLREIEKRAKTNPNEIPHYFSRDKNGKGEWKTGSEGGKDHASMPVKELDALREAAENGGSCAIVHTHPKSSGQNALPSIQDAIMENSLGKGCENIAVDSSGNRWKFDTTDEFKKRHDAFEKKFKDMDNSVKGTAREGEWNAEAQKALAMRQEGRFEDSLDHMIREGLSGKYGKTTQDRAQELANDGIARTARDYNRDVKRGLTKEEADHYIKRWGQEGFRITKR